MRAQDPVEKGDKETASHGENSEASRHSETLSLESTPVSECGCGWGCQKVRRKQRRQREALGAESQARAKAGGQKGCREGCAASVEAEV